MKPTETKLLLFITACILSISVQAQKTGLKGGVNFTNLYVEDVDDENLKVGFNLGLYHRAEISDILSIQPEFLFTQKGSEITYQSVFGSGSYRFNLNYLEVPVLAVASLGKLNIEAGPYLGLLIAAKTKKVNDDGTIDAVNNLDRSDFNTLDYGLAAGISFDFPQGLMGIRYNYGFMEVGKSNTAGNATQNSKNSALQVFVGFDF